MWVIFALLDLDPDPLARLNTDPIRIRIRNPGRNTNTAANTEAEISGKLQKPKQKYLDLDTGFGLDPDSAWIRIRFSESGSEILQESQAKTQNRKALSWISLSIHPVPPCIFLQDCCES